MADKKLSSVSAVSDMAYVYAETSSGETVKISKADLASVAAGLISFPFINGVTSDVASLSKSGLYAYNDSTMSATLGYTWGMIIHFQNAQDWGTFQLAVTNKDGDENLYFRKKGSNGWSNWRSI